ncbi:hypothetical protein GRF29_96g213498 [Pseudopithomyces chartarum]|uniref:Uncharacterized protein n=1 Tax=Pseudopithomyces chartarum TaxID=1892770 RepID=A0AAN6LWX2_9PLEO|nr:hypothetical protein GRF29_96g213498 [Pseudopithomyces chartarum]
MYLTTFFALLLPTTHALKIATSLQWIEHTPQAYAIANFYNGTSPATLVSGGVANLASDSSIGIAMFLSFSLPTQPLSHPTLSYTQIDPTPSLSNWRYLPSSYRS